ncbi:MAG: hypothetical protein CL610_16540 [Anaerolineaceae bacterium]|nr:hypothetical protein [Anaerolineaceae bacterium]
MLEVIWEAAMDDPERQALEAARYCRDQAPHLQEEVKARISRGLSDRQYADLLFNHPLDGRIQALSLLAEISTPRQTPTRNQINYLTAPPQLDATATKLQVAVQRYMEGIKITESKPSPVEAEAIRIEPELGRMSTGAYMAGEFRLWCICQELTRQADGSGKVAKKALRDVLQRYGINYTRQHYNALLRAGNRLFWNLSKRYVFLRSRQFVAVALAIRHPELVQTNRPGVREMYVSPAGSLERWEAMIYASWLMYREGPTISRIQLEKLFNRTQETIRRWERDRLQSIITIRPNYAQLHDPRAIDFTPPEDRFTYLAEVRTSTGTYIVERLSWRLPNTYSPTGIRQHHRKGQARKVRTAINHHLTNPADKRHGGMHMVKRYFDSGEAIRCYTQKHQTIGYLWRGETPRQIGIFEPSTDGFTRTRAGEKIG